MPDDASSTRTPIDPALLATLSAAEEERFVEEHPVSRRLAGRAGDSLLGGVPMSWMLKWPGTFPLFLEEARDARLLDVDGHEYVDFCLGDTAAMAGHSPPAVAAAVAGRASCGVSAMLPTEDSIRVGEELARRFGLPFWQFCLSATDANRFALRLARWLTGRPRVLVFNWCYHGTVDESFIAIRDGVTESRPGNIGPAVDPTVTTRVVEFNDLEALEAELAHGDVAAVMTEPALTNIGIVPPEEGFHAGLRELTRTHGSLLLIDETHTVSAGPGGMTARDGLEPDLLSVGKAIGGGVPAAAWGMSEKLAGRVLDGGLFPPAEASGGVGGTLAANALSLAAMRATLEEVLTPDAYEVTIPLARRLTDGVEEAIERRGLPWHIVRLGCRAEYRFRPEPPRDGAQAANDKVRELDHFLHLFALNRGVMLTPFHSMALISPVTSVEDVDRHTEVFNEALDALS